MKNYATPRTLADASFVTGYSSACYINDAARIERRAHVVMYVLAVIFAALLVAGYFGSIA
jgi:hypothetical protein